jgi:hypothetical protein
LGRGWGGQKELLSMGSLLREGGGATGGGGEIRPMAVVDNFMKIGKGSGSFVTNKLK